MRQFSPLSGGFPALAGGDAGPVATRRSARRMHRIGAAMKIRLLAVLLFLATSTVGRPARAQDVSGLSGRSDLVRAEAEGYWPEPRPIQRVIDVAVGTLAGDDTGTKNGIYAEMNSLVTGAGWLAGGPGFRYWLFGERAVVSAAAAYSWRGYRATQAHIEFPALARSRVALGSQYRWRDLTQISYFGTGHDAARDQRSEYRLTSHEVVAYAIARPTTTFSVGARVGWLGHTTLADPTGHFRRGFPSVLRTFPADPAVVRSRQPNYLTTDLSALLDTVRYRRHPVRGSLARATWSIYQDQDGGAFSFHRFEFEGARFIPTPSERFVLAVRGWGVGTSTASNRTVPFYLLPSVGGHNTLRAYLNYRFHDRHALVVNTEARVSIFTHVDAAVFVDAGTVAARVSDLTLDRVSLGVGLRLHTSRVSLLRLDVAHGGDGWRVLCTYK